MSSAVKLAAAEVGVTEDGESKQTLMGSIRFFLRVCCNPLTMTMMKVELATMSYAMKS